MCPGKPVNCRLRESKGDTEGGKGDMAEEWKDWLDRDLRRDRGREGRDGRQVNYSEVENKVGEVTVRTEHGDDKVRNGRWSDKNNGRHPPAEMHKGIAIVASGKEG